MSGSRFWEKLQIDDDQLEQDERSKPILRNFFALAYYLHLCESKTYLHFYFETFHEELPFDLYSCPYWKFMSLLKDKQPELTSLVEM